MKGEEETKQASQVLQEKKERRPKSQRPVEGVKWNSNIIFVRKNVKSNFYIYVVK